MSAKLGRVLGEEITWNWNSEVFFHVWGRGSRNFKTQGFVMLKICSTFILMQGVC